MNEVVSINIREENGKQTVSARELHEKLQVETRFDVWLSRMLNFGFVQGEDFCTILCESTGGRPATEYYISIDMAKEICMLQRSEIGRKFRQYFIECEKKLRESTPKMLPSDYKKALLQLVAQIEENEKLLEDNKVLETKYVEEKSEHEKDKSLVLNKYLTATYIKEQVFKKTGKNIIVSKTVQRIPIEDNDILYKPFQNKNYTGQQPVYHPRVLDKILEILC